MPLPGGPSDKAGNSYERRWTVFALLDLLEGRGESVRIEVAGTADVGAEFRLLVDGVAEWHRARQQPDARPWTVAALAREGVLTPWWPRLRRGERYVFVSDAGADELRGLVERADAAATWQAFERDLRAGQPPAGWAELRSAWGDPTDREMFATLRATEVRLIGEPELGGHLGARLRPLVTGPPATARAVLAGLADECLHREVTADDVRAHLAGHGIRERTPDGDARRPRRVGTPPRLADVFQRRSEVQSALDHAGPAGQAATVTQVLVGPGGSGKTQLAVDHAERACREGRLDLLVWVTATTRDAVVTAYGQAGRAVAAAGPDELADKVADRFLTWLAATARRWLVVLDDVADPADLAGLWPAGRTGQVLVTTRRRDVAAAAGAPRGIEVNLFTDAQALSYLTRRLPDDRLAEAGDLAQDLAGLPLTLAQAAAYVLERGPDCADYRRRLAERRAANVFPPGAGIDGYERSVATTWSLSVEAADALSPVGWAGRALHLASLLGPDGIPAALFSTPAAIAYLSGGQAADHAPDDADRALLNLRRLGLADVVTGTVHVHDLVQRVVREDLGWAGLVRAGRAAADALLQVWPADDRRPEHALLAQRLRAGTELLEARCPDAIWTSVAHEVLFRASRSLRDAGLLRQAVVQWERVGTTAWSRLGPDHSDTLTSRIDLGHVYLLAGRLDEALPLFERALVDCERVFGPDHPNTPTSRGNLAYAYLTAGRLDEALPLFERALADCERLLDADHPHTLNSLNHLALAYWDAGRPDEALPLFERTVTGRERVLGPDHPDTLTGRTNLASAYQAAGRPDEALLLFERTVTDCERALGPDHPDTLTSRSNLVHSYLRAGRSHEALPLFERVLSDCERVLGPDHPDTVANHHSLVAAYLDAGRFADAQALHERRHDG